MQKISGKAVNRLKLYLVFWIFLSIVFSTVIYMQVRKETALSAEIESLTAQVKSASAKSQVLQTNIDLKTSAKSIEDYAHKHLGLVYPNEIIIYDDNYQGDK